MCRECFDDARKMEIGTIRELAAVVGGIDAVAVSPHYDCDEFDIREHQDTCLCPTDLERTLLDAGMMIWRDEWGVVNFRAPPSASKASQSPPPPVQ